MPDAFVDASELLENFRPGHTFQPIDEPYTEIREQVYAR